jgi:hypothetical protein
LQGSYKNDTNIRGDSDIDVVVQLSSTFQPDLSQLSVLQSAFVAGTYSPAAYLWSDFRQDVLQTMREYYGASAVAIGKNSLKLKGDSGRLPADIVPCIEYRRYFGCGPKDYITGIYFYSFATARWITNYPKRHYDNGVDKNSIIQANGWYKRAVRMFKNSRTYLINRGIILSDLAPSYFLECLLYNVPNDLFGGTFQRTYFNLLDWLHSLVDLTKPNIFSWLVNPPVCQNGIVPLFGQTSEQWNLWSANYLVARLTDLWYGVY